MEKFEINKKINKILKEKFDLEVAGESFLLKHPITVEERKVGEGCISIKGKVASDEAFTEIKAPQIRQILVALEGVLGEEPWKLREVRDGWVAEIKEGANTFVFEVSADLMGNKKRRFLKKMGLTPKPLGKNIWKRKEELQKQLEKYKLDKGDNYSAVYLCHRWLDGLNPLFDREPEKVLQELLEILKNN
jgi:hypothetical protein